MWKDAALITISVVLFVQMGLSEAILSTLGVESKILSCPKCLTFWSVLLWSIFHRNALLNCVAASFVSSYTALWLALLHDAIAIKYNDLYGKILSKHTAQASADAVSELRKTKKKVKNGNSV